MRSPVAKRWLLLASIFCFIIASILLTFSLAILIHPIFWLISAIGYGCLAIYFYRRGKRLSPTAFGHSKKKESKTKENSGSYYRIKRYFPPRVANWWGVGKPQDSMPYTNDKYDDAYSTQDTTSYSQSISPKEKS
jgi:hypothetical protein